MELPGALTPLIQLLRVMQQLEPRSSLGPLTTLVSLLPQGLARKPRPPPSRLVLPLAMLPLLPLVLDLVLHLLLVLRGMTARWHQTLLLEPTPLLR